MFYDANGHVLKNEDRIQYRDLDGWHSGKIQNLHMVSRTYFSMIVYSEQLIDVFNPIGFLFYTSKTGHFHQIKITSHRNFVKKWAKEGF